MTKATGDRFSQGIIAQVKCIKHGEISHVIGYGSSQVVTCEQ